MLKHATTLLIETSLPCKKKSSAKILSGNETSPYDDVCDVKIFYTVVNGKEDRFVQAEYQASRSIKHCVFKCCKCAKL